MTGARRCLCNVFQSSSSRMAGVLILLVARQAVAPSTLHSRPLQSLGLGCCQGPGGMPFRLKTGITMKECIAFCDGHKDCQALEHNPWDLGLCTLFDWDVTEVACPLSDKTCWSRAGGTPFDAEKLRAYRSWHAKEIFDALACKHSAPWMSFLWAQDIESSRMMLNGSSPSGSLAIDVWHLWRLVSGEGYLGTAKLGDTESFFAQDNGPTMREILSTIGYFQNVLRGDVSFDEANPQDGEIAKTLKCVYGFVLLLHVTCIAFMDLGQIREAREAAWLLRVSFWTQVSGPESQFDLIQSSGWPVHSWDIVALTRDLDPGSDERPPHSYSELLLKNPTPRVKFLPLAWELPLSVLGDRGLRVSRASPSFSWSCGPNARVKVAALDIMRPMMMHQLGALQAAFQTICGADLGPPLLEVTFAYVKAEPMSDYQLDFMGEDVDWESQVQQWNGMEIRFLPDGGSVIRRMKTLDDAERDMMAKLRQPDGALQSSEIFVCGEPVWVCTATSRALEQMQDTRPLLVNLGMTLLHMPDLWMEVMDSREEVARFFGHFLTLLTRPSTVASASARITQEQVFWQVGVRLPLTHFAGIHLTPSVERDEAAKVLLFRTKFPYLATVFLQLFKLLVRKEQSPLKLVDMNHFGSLTWAEISRFQSVVLMPHNVHLLRTNDLYALEMIMFVPSAPFIFQLIYPSSNTWGGHGAIKEIRLGLDRTAQRQLHRALGLHKGRYRLGIAPTVPDPGEILPREKFRYCPYRMPALGSCPMVGTEGTGLDVCPFGAHDLEDEAHKPVSCEEVLQAEPSQRSLAEGVCGMSSVGSWEADAEDDVNDQPFIDPFDAFYGDFNPWCNLESYRYWYEYTDYALLKGLQRFGSAAELLAGLTMLVLEEASEARRQEIVAEMRAHQRARVAETVHWWTQALMLTTTPERRE